MDIFSSILSIKQHDEGLKLIYQGQEINLNEVPDLRSRFQEYLSYEQEFLKKAFGDKSQVFDLTSGLKYFRYAFPLIFINSLIKDNTLDFDKLANNLEHGVYDGQELQ